MLAFLGPIGAPELVIILFIALLIFGSKLPSIMRNLGSSVNEFKKGMNDVADPSAVPAPAPAPVKDHADHSAPISKQMP